MNRQRLLNRDFEGEGTDDARQIALALAELCDRNFLELLLRHKVALDEFGGEIYLAAVRDKFDKNGRPAAHNDPEGSFLTYAYIVNYGSKAQLKVEAPNEEAAQPTPPAEDEKDDGEASGD
jgi:hypothetical protein